MRSPSYDVTGLRIVASLKSRPPKSKKRSRVSGSVRTIFSAIPWLFFLWNKKILKIHVYIFRCKSNQIMLLTCLFEKYAIEKVLFLNVTAFGVKNTKNGWFFGHNFFIFQRIFIKKTSHAGSTICASSKHLNYLIDVILFNQLRCSQIFPKMPSDLVFGL